MARAPVQREYKKGITVWYPEEESLRQYFLHVAQSAFPQDAVKAGILVDVMARFFYPYWRKSHVMKKI